MKTPKTTEEMIEDIIQELGELHAELFSGKVLSSQSTLRAN